MSFTFDFGFETASAPLEEAYAALLFACLGEEGDLGKAPGPLAIAAASRYVEFFEMQVGLSQGSPAVAGHSRSSRLRSGVPRSIWPSR